MKKTYLKSIYSPKYIAPVTGDEDLILSYAKQSDAEARIISVEGVDHLCCCAEQGMTMGSLAAASRGSIKRPRA